MKKKILYVFVCLCLMFLSFVIGFNIKSEDVIEVDDNVYLNEEIQTFRTKDGHKLSVIEYDGNKYIPITDKGLFLGKSVEIEDRNINIEDYKIDEEIIIDIDTETIDGIHFSNENLYGYDYTLLLNWSVWCPDCDKLLDSIVNKVDWFEENRVQLVGIPFEDFSEDEIDKVLDIKKKLKNKGLDFINIKLTTDLEDVFQSNIYNIPSVIVLDDKGRIKYRDDKVNILLEDLFNEINNISKCGDC